MPYAINGEAHIYYEAIGEGTPVVMLHGWFADSELWKEYGYVDALKNGDQLILIDDRAHGRSNKQYPPEQHTTENNARDVITVMDELGIESCHLVGFSGGGQHALSIAVLYPQRVRSVVVIGMSPNAGGSDANEQVLKLAKAGPETLIEFMGSMRAAPITEAAARRVRATDFKALICAASNPEDQNFEKALPDIKIPVLVMVGEEDNFFYHETLRGEYSPIPDLTFVALPGIGHSVEESDLILPHIKNFLARVGK